MPDLRLTANPPAMESAAPSAPQAPALCALAARVMRAFRVAADHRLQSGVDERLYMSLLAVRGEYTQEEKERFRMADLPADLYTPLSATKVRAAASQLHEIFNSPGDKPWVLSPTPMPTVPESVAQEAFADILTGFLAICRATGRIPGPDEMYRYAMNRMDEVHRREIEWAAVRAERMQNLVHDQMVEGGWIEAFGAYVDYLTVYGTALVKGPVPRTVRTRRVKENRYGICRYELEERERLSYEAVSPWDCYPAPGARTVSDGPLCLRVRFAADELWQWSRKASSGAPSVGADGGEWFPDAVRAILAAHPEGGVRLNSEAYDPMRSVLEDRGMDRSNDCLFEGVEYFGAVRGSELRVLGVMSDSEGAALDPFDYYEAHCVVVDGHVVYCRLMPPGMGRPVSKGVFYARPDAWWGGSVAEYCASAQRIVNCCLRNLVNNVAMASGPQVFMKDFDRLMDKSPGALKMHPFKLWAFEAGMAGNTDNPMGVLSVPSTMQELLAVFAAAKQQADEDTGIPAYTYGTNVAGGAGRTASGLAMLTEAANRGMKMVVTSTDRDVVRDIVRRTVAWNLMWGRDASVKGDCEVNPSGTMGMILREQESNRRKQALSLAMNPVGLQLFGPKLSVAIMREEAKTLGLPNLDDVLPSKERMEEQEMLQELQQYNAAMTGAADARGAAAGQGPDSAAMPQNPQARVEANPAQVAMEQGAPSAAPPGQVAERRGAA